MFASCYVLGDKADKGGRNFIYKAGGFLTLRLAEDDTPGGAGKNNALPGPGEGHIKESAFLLNITGPAAKEVGE